MQPPQYSNAPQPKSKVGLILMIVAGVICLCCVLPGAVCGYFGYNGAKQALGFMGCGMSISHMHAGVVAYAKAHDGKLPGKDKWQEDIRQYVKPIGKKGAQFQMPEADGDVCDLGSNTSVCYNADLAGKKLSEVKDDAILLWEVPEAGHDQAKPFSKPNDSTGPILMLNKRRGWIQQPVEGDAYFTDEKGSVVNVNSSNMEINGTRE